MNLEFRSVGMDAGDGLALADAMRAEIAVMYDGLALDGPSMPAAGPAELSPPGGLFLVGYLDARAVCCGGIKRLDAQRCELKKMYVVPDLRGRGIARRMLRELERRAGEIGYHVARLDTGPAQVDARGLYESEGYQAIRDFNGNPVAVFWGEKRLDANA